MIYDITIWEKSKGASSMKNKTFNRRRSLPAALVLALCLLLPAAAQAFDAQTAGAWLDQFAAALESLEPLNSPQDTADPARAGEYLIEYPFGTVTAASPSRPQAGQITEIDVRHAMVTDCRGVRVGMGLADALDGRYPGASATQLYVLGTQETGYGWSWAYLSGGEVYGVEYIAYDTDAVPAREYTLTYVIEAGAIAAIRMRMAEATQAQAIDALKTAQEIADRQHGEVLAAANGAPVFTQEDLQVGGVRALGADVASVAGRLGDPLEIQTLPGGAGRILLYDGAALTLGLDEYTGVERVRSVSVSAQQLRGPRGLAVGMSIQEAAALFFCERDVSSLGGALYLAGEALGEAPCGELIAGANGEAVLRYACLTDGGEAVLEAGARAGAIAYWRLYYAGDESAAEGGA